MEILVSRQVGVHPRALLAVEDQPAEICEAIEERIAVDPIDGTSLAAARHQDALSMIAVTDQGAMFGPSLVLYMDKIVTGSEGVEITDIRRRPTLALATLRTLRL